MTASRDLNAAAGQFARFAVVGVVSNAALFLMYLLMTQLGLGHKLAATVAYVLGVLQTFVFNRSWSFRHPGRPGPALGRYVATYALGYAVNIVGLCLFVDLAGLQHQWVQGVMIVTVAACLFLLQKFWVFPDAGEA